MLNNKKTIKEIADEIGVSKTAVRKKITETIRNRFAETIGNTIYIDQDGVNLIKSMFNGVSENENTNQVSDGLQLVSGNQTETVSDSLRSVSDQVSDGLRSVSDQVRGNDQVDRLIDMLQKELEMKNKQIDDLNNRLEEVTSALTTAQQNITNEQVLHASTIQKQLTGGSSIVTEEKQGFFKRIFKNKKKN